LKFSKKSVINYNKNYNKNKATTIEPLILFGTFSNLMHFSIIGIIKAFGEWWSCNYIYAESHFMTKKGKKKIHQNWMNNIIKIQWKIHKKLWYSHGRRLGGFPEALERGSNHGEEICWYNCECTPLIQPSSINTQ